MENAWKLDEESCFAFTLHLFGSGMGGYLVGALIADVLLINMVDMLCPPWWGEVILAGPSKIFQRDLNTLYEGVDQQPFLRYQMLMKFLLLGLFFGSIERIGYLWVAICFWQCLEIDRYCYIRFYNKPPFYNSSMLHIVIEKVLPLGLFTHVLMHLIFFCLDWSWSPSDGLAVGMRSGPIPIVAGCFVLFVLFFLVAWMMPLKIWKFEEHSSRGLDSDVPTGSLKETISNLNFRDALVINEANEKKHDLTHFTFIDVRKYIPDPRRRGFGILKLN